ncbi:hypothetical protein [Aquimarina macrocephali]|uniref:hypothetical protein n=1 Tax=Aquimarina macrocephali TaxID=666563 RepID=UPI003F6640F2
MYSESSILSLVDRIGFGDYQLINIDDSNIRGASGRLFSFYHKLITVNNLYETVEEVNMRDNDFNSYLTQLKTDSVKAILADIFNKNRLYQTEVDYSDIIINQPELFDDAIGYSLAISGIQQMISTTRINSTVRKAEGAYQAMKIELEGLKVDGIVRSVGIKSDLKKSIRNTSDIIFPDHIIVDSKQVW